MFEQIDDAAEVHRLTGTAPAVALHFPWDAVDDLGELRDAHEAHGLRVGAVNPNLFQDPDYRLGSITNPDAAIRGKALEHLLDCVEIAAALGSSALSLWFADGTNYPGRTICARAPARLGRPRQALRARCRTTRSCSSSTSCSSRRSTRPTSPTGARRCCSASELGPRARVLVDLGHHAQGVNIEQIVALLARGSGSAASTSTTASTATTT